MDIQKIKQLRKETKAPVMECKKALEEAGGRFGKAKKLLQKWGAVRAAKKEGREIKEGVVKAYIHTTGKLGALVSLGCETDFVARTEEFKKLAHEIAMQVAAMNPKDVKELLKQPYIRDPKMTVSELIKQTVAKVGENIKIKAFSREEI